VEIIAKNNEILNQALISKVRKGEKKGQPKKSHKENSYSSNHGNNYLIHLKFFKRQKMGHYASQFLEKRQRTSNIRNLE
jgi:hypothetical protein